MRLVTYCLLFTILMVCPSSFIFSNSPTYCKYNDDPIIVESDQHREMLQMSGEENLISICGLKIGETYELNGFSPNNFSCQFTFKSTTAALQLTDSSNENVIDITTASMTFKATAECMDVVLVNNSCIDIDNYPVNLSIFCFTCIPESGESLLPPNLEVDPNWTAEDLIQDIFIGGDCFDVSGVSLVGSNAGIGQFAAGDVIGIEKGIILSTGNVTSAPGPNNGNASSGTAPNNTNDPDLLQLSGNGTMQNCNGIEFDFIPTLDVLTFQYVFASEEYCEWVGQYNDAFGFFISGPGINGPFSNNAENIALIPGTNTEVAINTVNHNTNSNYFYPNVSNCGGTTNTNDIQFDGYTHIFTAEATGLVPCETYHIKLVVGDASDQAFDTGVFLAGNSFTAGGEINSEAVVPGTGGNVAIEACQDGQFVFTRPSIDLTNPLTIDFTISGTATAGLDYVPFMNSITIPAGTNTFFLDVDILPDGIAEGQETITITLDQDACSCLGQETTLIIEDYIDMDIPDEETSVCGPQSSTLSPDITGGAPNFTYLWSTGASSPTINVSPNTTTIYTVTVTDQCGNTAENTQTVTVLDAPTATTSGTAAVCAEDPNPTATIVVTFTGVGPWDLTYLYNGTPVTITGITNNPFDLIVDGTGTYTLTQVVGPFCDGTASGSAVVTEVDVELASFAQDVACNGDQSGSIDVTVVGGDFPYAYSWDNGAITEDLIDIGIGTYILTVTDNNGCTETISVDISEPTALSSDIAQVSPLLCNGDVTGAIDLTVNGGSPAYFYQWSSGHSTEDISQLPAGTYTVTVTDLNNCSIVETITLTQPEPLLSNSIVTQNVSCFGGSNGAADLTVNGGTPPYFYNWSNGETTQNPDNFMVGVYTVTVTDLNGCTTVNAVNISEPPPILAQVVEVNGVDCANPFGGTADLIVAGGTPGYTYAWDNGSPEQDPDDLDAGIHTVTITDANGCTETADVEITSDTEEPIVDVSVSGDITCIDLDATLDGSGSTGSGTLSYEWQDENGDVISTSASTDVTIAGTYTLIVTNEDNGCTSSTTALVEEDADLPTADAQVSGLLDCINTSATLDGSGSTGVGTLEYEWQNANGDVITDQISTDVTIPGDYTLIVTDIDNGCTASMTVNVGQDIAAPNPDAQVSGMLTCTVGSVTLDGSGSTGNGTISHEWFDGNTSLGTGATIDVSSSGTYTLVITDGSNGCTSETTIDVNENTDIPVPDAQVSGVLDCIDLTATLDGSGSTGTGTLEYEWTDPNGDSAGSTAQIDSDIPGIYTLVITDADNGCTSETTIELLQNITPPDALASVSETLTCTTTSVTINGSGSTGQGSLGYEWTDPNGDPAGSTMNLDVSVPGTYTLIVTDSENGCTAETTVEVLQSSDIPVPDVVASGILTCDVTTVTLDGSGSTGNGTLEYEWFDSNGNSIGNTIDIDIVDPDDYTLIVTDIDNGCTSETSLNVIQDIAEPAADAGPSSSLTCTETTVTLDGSGSSTGNNISYQWLNNGGVDVGSTITVDVTETGTYTLIVTNDDNGCTASSTVEITPDASIPVADAGLGSTLTCVVNQVTLDGSGSSSGNNISYEWLDPNGDPIDQQLIIDVTQIGTYTLVVTNSDNGCSSSSSVEVDQDITPPSADAGSVQFLTCTDTDVTLDASASTGNNLTYEWFDEAGDLIAGTVTVTVSSAEVYTVIVTNNDNGCTEESTVEVQEDTVSPISDAGADGLLNCTILDYTLDGSNSSGGTLEYEWQDPNGIMISTVSTVSVSSPGIYTLIITDTDNGCTSSSTAFVDQDINDPVAEAGNNGLLNCIIGSVDLDAGASTGGTLEYEWQDPNGDPAGNTQIITASDVGIYTVIVTDTDNGCTATDQVEVTGDFVDPIADAGPEGLLTCAVTDVTLDGSGSTANGSTIGYEWFDQNNSPLGTGPTVSTSTPGTYTLIITNQDNGCTSTTTVFVDENTTPPTADAGQSATLTCTETEVTLTGNGSSQSGNVAFEWQNSGGVVVGNQATVIVDQTGTYTLVVTDTDNGCTAVSTVDVVPDANLPTADAGASSTLTCDITIATLDGGNSSSGTNFDYEWQDSNGTTIGTGITTDVSTPGVYTLIVTDTDNGCTTSSSVEIFENVEIPNAFAGPSSTLTCSNTDATLDGSGSTISSGGLAYEWTDPQGGVIGTSATVIVAQPGTYTLTVTGDNGCVATDQVEVFIDTDAPIADVGLGGTLDCNVSVITLGGNGTSSGPEFIYDWQDANGISIASSMTTDISVPGTYTLIVTDSNNDCETTQAITILEDIEEPTADVGVSATLTCDLTDYLIGGSNSSSGPEFTYEWTNSNGDVIATDPVTSVSVPDTYILLITDTSNGCTSSNQIIIDQNIDTPVADAGQGGILTCDISTITLDGSNSTGSNLSYEWQNEAGVVVSTQPIFDADETGTFTLIVTNTSNGCSSESIASITPDSNLPTAIASPDGILTCTVNDVMIDGTGSSSISGGISFEWQDDQGNIVSIADTYNTSIPGVYTLIVTDTDNGCTATTSLEVLQDIEAPTSDAGPNQTLICGVFDIQLTGVGGNGNNLGFEWFDDQGISYGTTETVIVASPGIYTFVVTNMDNGCSASSEVEVLLDTNIPTAEAGTASTLTCTTTSVTLDGSASSTGSNIIYEWQDENGNVIGNGVTIDVTDPGTYTIIVIDTNNNCQSEDQVSILEDTNAPTAFADYGAATSLDCNNTSIILDGSGSAPFGDLTFQWTTNDGSIVSGDDTFNPEIDAPGTYTLLVTNTTNGCTDTQDIIVDQDITPPNVVIQNPGLLTCATTEVSIDATGSSQNGNYTYIWTGNGIVSGDDGLEPVVNQPGTITVTITNNDNGCVSQGSITIDQDITPPDAVATSNDLFDCLTESVTLSGNGSSSGAGFSYLWSGNGLIDNETSLSPTVYGPGVYTLEVTNAANGCTQTTNVTVEEDPNTPTGIEALIDNPLCFGDQGSISILETIGGTPPILYSLDGGQNFSGNNLFTNLEPGNYNLVIQDAIGCEYSETLYIEGVTELDVEVEPSILLNFGDNYEINALINVPIQEIDTIIWTPTDGLSCTDCLNPSIDTILNTTTYTVTVINENGCVATDEIILRVNKDREVYIPNAFTPGNLDGINDYLTVFANSNRVTKVNSFQVFDRWGELVFERYNFQPNDPTLGWDGRLRGEALNPAVFIYWAEIEFIDGSTELFKGSSTIVD